MKITLTKTGKRYNREWIFRDCSLMFEIGKSYAITGANGSGKSTLLQVIAGALMASEGEVVYELNNNLIDTAEHFRNCSIAAPYLELIEEMTAMELLDFHGSFKNWLMPASDILKAVGLEKAAHKQIRHFSSGMKQRLKLAQAFFVKTAVLLLDEPTTNLDLKGIELYHQLIQNYSAQRIVIVCSNDRHEYEFCQNIIPVEQFKI